LENLKGRDQLQVTNIDLEERITLKRILKEHGEDVEWIHVAHSSDGVLLKQ